MVLFLPAKALRFFFSTVCTLYSLRQCKASIIYLIYRLHSLMDRNRNKIVVMRVASTSRMSYCSDIPCLGSAEERVFVSVSLPATR